MLVRDRQLSGWSDDAQAALNAGEGYFLRWYTIKSLALVAVFGLWMYERGRRSSR